jgi:hypothetical protein
VPIEPLQITYVRCDYPSDIETLLESKILDFCKLFIADSYRSKQQLVVLFYSQPLKGKSWFTPKSPEWESWTITVEASVARTEREQVAAKKHVANVLREKLIEVSQRTGEEKVYLYII